MQVYVQRAGESLAVEVPSDATAADVVAAWAAQGGGEVRDMRLLWHGEPLRPSAPLSDSGVCAEARLVLDDRCMRWAECGGRVKIAKCGEEAWCRNRTLTQSGGEGYVRTNTLLRTGVHEWTLTCLCTGNWWFGVCRASRDLDGGGANDAAIVGDGGLLFNSITMTTRGSPQQAARWELRDGDSPPHINSMWCKISVTLDCDAQTLAFCVNGAAVDPSPAFVGIDMSQGVYPCALLHHLTGLSIR